MVRTRVGHSRKTRLGWKVGADMLSHQDPGAPSDARACCSHLVLGAVRIVPCPVEASFCSEVPRRASVGVVRSHQEPEAGERQGVQVRVRSGEGCGEPAASAVPPLARLHRDSPTREELWGLACGPGLLGDQLGSLAPDRPLESRVEAADDAGHGSVHPAPAPHRRAHLTSVFPLCRPSCWSCLWPGPRGRVGSRGCSISTRRRLARAAESTASMTGYSCVKEAAGSLALSSGLSLLVGISEVGKPHP